MLRRIFSGLIAFSLVFVIATGTRAETTVPPLSFNVVSALAKEKDLQKGLGTAVKQQNVEWFWELGGGIEKAMTANNEAEFTEALGKKVELIKTLHSVGMAYAEGKYTDAAIAIADSAVGSLNNPAATAVWEMMKMTRESYIAVKNTKDALNIVRLYNRVNKDRKLIGSSRGSEPPTIDIDSGTVDYFFNEYLITDPGVRAMVRSYVEKVLNQDWPEESWSSYAKGMLTGYGEETRTESELRQLQSREFKNVARGWIRSLLADVNKQVTLEYYRMRLRQEMTEFAKYAEKVGTYYESGYPMMWQILRARKNAAKKIPRYKEALKKAKEDIAKAQKDLADAKKEGELVREDEKEKAYSIWYPVLNDHNQALLRAAAGAYTAEDLGLYNSIEDAKALLSRTQAALYEAVKQKYDGEPDIPAAFKKGRSDKDGVRMPDPLNKEIMLEKYLRPLIVVQELDGYKSQVNSVIQNGVKQHLNHGDFNGAEKFWSKRLGDTHESVWRPVYKQMEENRKELEDYCAIDPLELSEPNLKAQARQHPNYQKRKQSNLGREAMDRIYERALSNYVSQWKRACKQAKKESKRAERATLREISEMMNPKMREVMGAFSTMKNTAMANYDRLEALINKINEMTLREETLRKKETNGKSLYEADKEGGWCTGVGKARDPQLYRFGGHLKNLAYRVGDVGGSEEYLRQLTAFVDERIATHKAAYELWKERLPMSQEDLRMIAVLTDKGKNVFQEIKDMDEFVGLIPGFVSAAERDLKKYVRKASSEYKECESLKDELIIIGGKLQEWEDEAIKSGLLKASKGKLMPAGIKKIEDTGMALTDEPYRHYLTQTELQEISGKLKNNPPGGGVLSYLKRNYKTVYNLYLDLINLKGIEAAPGENMILRDVIYLDDVEDMALRFEEAEAGQESFRDLMDEAAEKFPDIVQKHAATYLIFQPQPQDIEAELESLTGKAYVELAKTIKRRWTDHTDKITAEMLARQKEAQEKWEEEQKKRGTFEPIDASGYWIVDPRVNYSPYPAGASKVMLTKTDMRGGKIYLTGRINTLENVDKVLLSVDGRRTWEELPRAPTLAFYITPKPGKQYKPYVKLVRSPGFPPVVLSLSNDAAIVYTDESYTERIMGAIKLIAEAYERQNLALFSDLIADDYLGGRVALEEGVRFDFEMFTNIRLKLYIKRITEAGRGKFVVTTKWDKSQTPRSTGAQQKSSGETIITLIEQGGALKIQNLRGDLLYATLSPDVASASGLTQDTIDEIRTARDNRTPSQPGAGNSESGGGVGDDGVVLVSTKTVTKTFGAGTQCYDFDNDAWAGKAPPPSADPAGSDICFEGASSWTQSANSSVFQDMSATNTFANLSTAPDGGYIALDVMPNTMIGKVHAFKSSGSKYGKMELTSAVDVHGDGSENVISFKFAIQTDGSKNVATQ